MTIFSLPQRENWQLEQRSAQHQPFPASPCGVQPLPPLLLTSERQSGPVLHSLPMPWSSLLIAQLPTACPMVWSVHSLARRQSKAKQQNKRIYRKNKNTGNPATFLLIKKWPQLSLLCLQSLNDAL